MDDKNLYKELIDIIERNHLKICKESTYDAASGWTGCYYKILDDKTVITDLSGNGYCFFNSTLEECLKTIKKYLSIKNMSTIDDFREWCDKYAEEG